MRHGTIVAASWPGCDDSNVTSKMNDKHIESVHGSGGRRARDLIEQVFLRRLGPAAAHEVMSVNSCGEGQLVTTMDGFVVTPRVFPGGDIGLRRCMVR